MLKFDFLTDLMMVFVIASLLSTIPRSPTKMTNGVAATIVL